MWTPACGLDRQVVGEPRAERREECALSGVDRGAEQRHVLLVLGRLEPHALVLGFDASERRPELLVDVVVLAQLLAEIARVRRVLERLQHGALVGEVCLRRKTK